MIAGSLINPDRPDTATGEVGVQGASRFLMLSGTPFSILSSEATGKSERLRGGGVFRHARTARCF